MNAADPTLDWTGRVLAEEHLRRHLNGHRAVRVPAGCVVTPLAWERLKATEVTLVRSPGTAALASGGYAQERPFAAVEAAVAALARDGTALRDMPAPGEDAAAWAVHLGHCVTDGACGCRCGVVFCHEPGLVACVANKVPGVRAVPVTTVDQTARATRGFGANLVCVEMPGRTFYEVRQLLALVCGKTPACPADTALTLKGLDGDAHR